MADIISLKAREILDSRGIPTVETDVRLSDGSFGRASVPSGASTGKHEALERRDNDKRRFNGKGVQSVVDCINRKIAKALYGAPAENQRMIDALLSHLDGTIDKKRLGGNATLSVSLAVARAGAKAEGIPLYRYLGGVNAHLMPVPMMNILNGGEHADNRLDFQEFMIMPIGASSFREAIRMGAEVFHVLKDLLKQSGFSTAVGDEGGFAPDLRSTKEALDFLLLAVENAGYRVGRDVVLALDVASSTFYKDGIYHLSGENKRFKSERLIDYYTALAQNYPIFSIEDALAEDDWQGWTLLTERLKNKLQLVGDDLFTTNTNRLQKGIEHCIANAILVKPNQIGTLTETIEAIELAQKAGYATIVSHRSGETEDTFIADLAVGMNCGQIKVGSLSRGERVAKYNRLLQIEEELGKTAVYNGRYFLKGL